MQPEVWLRGPVEGVDPYLLPVAHALLQAVEDLERAAASLTAEELWLRPGGAASVGFHLRHTAGTIDRLLTYAQGRSLGEDQLAALKQEGEPGAPPTGAEELLRGVRAAVEHAVEFVRGTPPERLLEPREVGRKRLPSTVLGLLFHAAEHTQRHTGQVITTIKIVRGLGLAHAGEDPLDEGSERRSH